MYTLYVDESGKPNLRLIDSSRPHFSFASIITKNENERLELRERADQIKFKYWGKTNIFFHAEELRSLSGLFYRFRKRNPELPISDFYTDFTNLLTSKEFLLGIVCLNKTIFLDNNPTLRQIIDELDVGRGVIKKYDPRYIQAQKAEVELVKELASKALVMYLSLLRERNVNGRVVVEATGDPQDIYIFEVYNRLLINGCSELGMSTTEVRKHLTSISFVTKNNHDIETQLADAAAYFLNMSERHIDGIEPNPLKTEHERIIDALRAKSFQYRESATGPLLDSLHRHC